MTPSYHLTDMPFWIAVLLLILALAYFMIQHWIRKFNEYVSKREEGGIPTNKVIRHFFFSALISILCIAAVVVVIVSQGSKASLENTAMAPTQVTNPIFVQTHKEATEKIRPNTIESLAAQRQATAQEKEREDSEAAAKQRQEIGKDMFDFRTRVMNRDGQPPQNQDNQQPTETEGN